MRIIHTTLVLAVCLLFVPAFTGCSIFGADDGAIHGVVFYSDNTTPVPNPWVAMYKAETPDEVFLLIHGDDKGRYNAIIPEGNYIALGSTSQSGPFTGIDAPFGIGSTITTVKRITIDEEAP